MKAAKRVSDPPQPGPQPVTARLDSGGAHVRPNRTIRLFVVGSEVVAHWQLESDRGLMARLRLNLVNKRRLR